MCLNRFVSAINLVDILDPRFALGSQACQEHSGSCADAGGANAGRLERCHTIHNQHITLTDEHIGTHGQQTINEIIAILEDALADEALAISNRGESRNAWL